MIPIPRGWASSSGWLDATMGSRSAIFSAALRAAPTSVVYHATMSSSDGSFLKSSVPLPHLLLIGAVALAGYGGWTWWHATRQADHRHDLRAHGGIIVAVGTDHYHIEALFTAGGGFKLFPLGHDEVASTDNTGPENHGLRALARTCRGRAGGAWKPARSRAIHRAKHQCLRASCRWNWLAAQLLVVVPSITINNARYRFSFLNRDEHQAEMPRKVTDEAERQLYLTAGGKLTEADIKANHSQTASQKYRGFHSVHDMHPKSGELICPVTQTKANPKCTWIVGGKQYQFCCPPCIDEFVKLAKEIRRSGR